MDALVTGGAGFIGSHLVEELLRRGRSVSVIDNLSSGTPGNLIHLRDFPNLNIVDGQADDARTMAPLISGCRVVFHLAAIVGVPRVCLEPGKTLEMNFMTTRTVAKLCRKYNVKMILASTSEAYGKNDKKPLTEEDDAVIGPTNVPRWSYAVSKLADEYMVRDLMRDLPSVIVRYFNIYGPRMDPSGTSSVIARFIRQACQNRPLTVYGDGTQSRSFSYVTDAVAGTLAAAEMIDTGLFNIGRPREITINDLSRLIIKMTGSKSLIDYCSPPPEWGRFEEQYQRLPSIDLARKEFGFNPEVELEEGLLHTVKWMRAALEREDRRRKAG